MGLLSAFNELHPEIANKTLQAQLGFPSVWDAYEIWRYDKGIYGCFKGRTGMQIH